MIKIFELACSGFLEFFAVISVLYVMLYFPTNLILQLVHKAIRARTIKEKGYPPPHCDGDGDKYSGDKSWVEENF